MSKLRRPLDQCVNGCEFPPQPPSEVLCEKCLAKLDKKMNELFGPEEGK